MFKQLIILCVLAVIIFTNASEENYSYGETLLTIDYYKPKSNCKQPASPPQKSDTFVLGQCYAGKMYLCDSRDQSVTYMIYPDVNCGAMYPKTYGLPSDMCLSPTYGYSEYDSYFTCT